MIVTAVRGVRAYTHCISSKQKGARVMTTTNTLDLELTEAELERVIGGDTALQHEAVHAGRPNIGGPYHPPLGIIAILIG
jgi:hypothetical protein